MKKIIACLLLICQWQQSPAQQFFTISKEKLKDKIKGGWAGQTIGVTYGAPVEFRFQGSMINDYQPLAWYDGLIKKSMLESPGIYDDLYMDITFVEVFAHEGLHAPARSHANAIANAGYMLWHANQAARYNILYGIEPPQSGHWINNPHADCIDYQIESDFAGLMSPAMPNAASEISDKIGHIMNYGDGWYGGVYIGAMYALAFTSNDIRYIVKEGLKTIPKNTKYHECISDVIRWHAKYPNDWKATWFEIQKKWTNDIGCPGGVYSAFNIDATVNSAYVVLGLLYGNGDYTKTIDISTRAGQDADCNPSSAAGILGAMLGYKAIPAYWKMGLTEAEDINFKYTSTSLNKVYELSYAQALQNILQNGGREDKKNVMIKKQIPAPVKWEQSFTGMLPFEKKWIGIQLSNEYNFDFSGNAFVIEGEYKPTKGSVHDAGITAVARIEMYIDEQPAETIELPMSFTTRRHEIAWKYQLPDTKHKVRLKLLNPEAGGTCFLTNMVLYKGSK
ncbi:MAG: ADP-ribosylglycohydrolase family protein [Ferruginibacter sp.]